MPLRSAVIHHPVHMVTGGQCITVNPQCMVLEGAVGIVGCWQSLTPMHSPAEACQGQHHEHLNNLVEGLTDLVRVVLVVGVQSRHGFGEGLAVLPDRNSFLESGHHLQGLISSHTQHHCQKCGRPLQGVSSPESVLWFRSGEPPTVGDMRPDQDSTL